MINHEDASVESFFSSIFRLIESVHRDSKKIALWGLGRRGRQFLKECIKRGKKFDYYIDKIFASTPSIEISNQSITISNYEQIKEDIDLIICSIYDQEMINEIKKDVSVELMTFNDFWTAESEDIHFLPYIRYQEGHCPFCDKDTFFYSTDYWLRDNYKCNNCKAIPRQRAIMKVIRKNEPDFCDKAIHESSPGNKSLNLMRKIAPNYTWSHFYQDCMLGMKLGENFTNQNLEKLSFADSQFDIFITQDVMEHVNNPERAYTEIARVLKKGGKHIFTTPIYLFQKTEKRVEIKDEDMIFLKPKRYHGNPISREGSLVTIDYGDDIAEYIDNICGNTKTVVIQFEQSEENVKNGLEADFLHVIITEKTSD